MNKTSVSRDQVLAVARQQSKYPLKMRELARALSVPDRNYPEFRNLIRRMVRDGSLVKLRHNKYGVPAAHGHAVGRIAIQTSGYGLVAPGNGAEEIFVAAKHLDQALHGDRVVVRVTCGARGDNRPEGELIRIVARAEQRVVGTYMKNERSGFFVSNDPRISVTIPIPNDHPHSAEHGQKVVVHLTFPSVHAHPQARIVEVLGDSDDPTIETLAFIKKRGLPLEFPGPVLEAADAALQHIPPAEIERRLDLRALTCFTIDPADARDHDDAVSLQVLDDGNYCLGIHIADVSHYVPEGSPLDREAMARGCSVYLPDRVIPMLPEKLSANICSLRPCEDRLTMSILTRITPEGELIDAQIAETIIRSRARLSYEDVQAVLDQRDGDNPAQAFADILKRMDALRSGLMAKRRDRGAIDFEIPEPQIVLDDEGQPIHIHPRARLNSHRLIEEFMLLGNEIVARYMAERRLPILYRVHEPPDGQKLAEFFSMGKALGYRLSKHALTKGKSASTRRGTIQQFLDEFKGKPIGHILCNRLLRSMKKAVYTPVNRGHFGLACDTYTHFTSPIRRYPDLILHRALRDALNDATTPASMARRARRLPDIGDLTTEREIAAQRAEWDAVQLMQILYLENKLGQHFDATIVDVRPIGFFVQLCDVLIEGLVHVKYLYDDYYIYHELQGTLVGDYTGKTFRIGDSVRVQLAQLDRQRLRIDFHLLSHKKNNNPKRSRKRRGGR